MCACTTFQFPGTMLTRRPYFTRYTDRDIFSLGSLKIRILTGFANGLSVICDILITVALCYFLNSKRTGFRRYVLSRHVQLKVGP